jgi:hypothetical protein
MPKKSRKEKAELDPAKVCKGGYGFDRQTREPHEKLGDEKDYTCMGCGRWQGCRRCIPNVSDIVCTYCEDWANLKTLRRHGPMVKDPELKGYGMKLVSLCGTGKITEAEMKQLWNTACGLTRDGQKH